MESIEHFHPFLYGRHFIVLCDHLPLSWLRTKLNLSSRLARWLIRLSPYDYEIQYKKAPLNGKADALSRLPDEDEINEENNFNDLVIFVIHSDDQGPTSNLFNRSDGCMIQYEDENLEWMIKLIETHGDVKSKIDSFRNDIEKALYIEYDQLRLRNGKLFRMFEDRNGVINYQFVLPAHMINEVIKNVHSSLFGGHLGFNKTFQKIYIRFYFPNLREYVKNFVKCCDICQKVKSTQPLRDGEMIYLRPCRPNQIITTDIAGPFPVTANRYVMIVVCSFIKWIEVYPLKTTIARDPNEGSEQSNR